MKQYNPKDEPYYNYFKDNGYQFLDSGYMHCIFEKENKIYKIPKSKFSEFNHLENYLTEKKSMKILQDNNIPVPKVYEIKQEEINGELYQVLVEEKVNGIVKSYKNMNEKEKEAIYKILTKTCEINLQHYGPLKLDENNKYGSWNAYLQFLCNIARETVKKYNLQINIEKLIAELCNQNISEIVPSFLILDPNEKNIIFNNEGEIMALIDVDHPLGGDPLYQIAGFKYFLNDFYEFILKKGYISIEQQKKINLYTIIFSINDLYFRTNAESKPSVETNEYIEKILRTYNELYRE